MEGKVFLWLLNFCFLFESIQNQVVRFINLQANWGNWPWLFLIFWEYLGSWLVFRILSGRVALWFVRFEIFFVLGQWFFSFVFTKFMHFLHRSDWCNFWVLIWLLPSWRCFKLVLRWFGRRFIIFIVHFFHFFHFFDFFLIDSFLKFCFLLWGLLLWYFLHFWYLGGWV